VAQSSHGRSARPFPTQLKARAVEKMTPWPGSGHGVRPRASKGKTPGSPLESRRRGMGATLKTPLELDYLRCSRGYYPADGNLGPAAALSN
jgi:hypothetical protein